MATPNFTELWAAVDDSLDKITCLLKGAVCLSEYTQHEEETAMSLVNMALERAESFERQLRELNNHYLDLEKETGKFEATPIETDQPA
jgi:hypothetical protein